MTELTSVTLSCDGAHVTLINYGAITADWRIDVDGTATPMILGYQDLNDYPRSPYYFGAIVGRVSNRIGGGRFALPDGTIAKLATNEGATTLHGGPNGLGSVYWSLTKTAEDRAELTYRSEDGEGGFPGCVDVKVIVTLTEKSLTYDMSATVDRPTPISLAQHNYYNFGGTADIWDYSLKMPSHQVLEQNDIGVSTGSILDTTGSTKDFRAGQSMAAFKESGLDGHFVFDADALEADDLPTVADMRAPNGLGLRVFSDQLGAQIYTAHGLDSVPGGLNGQTYGRGAGLCVEPQGHPNAVNIAAFPSVMATPDAPYRQVLRLEILQPEDA